MSYANDKQAVCQICGAVYSHSSGRQMHTRATGHNDFKIVKRPKA
jgi:rubredoxin